jgi:hypothetical protein
VGARGVCDAPRRGAARVTNGLRGMLSDTCAAAARGRLTARGDSSHDWPRARTHAHACTHARAGRRAG